MESLSLARVAYFQIYLNWLSLGHNTSPYLSPDTSNLPVAMDMDDIGLSPVLPEVSDS